MDSFIISGNIKRFEQKLKRTKNEHERKVLRDLLATERRRLLESRLINY